MKFAVGSKNPSKIACAQLIGDRLFGLVEVTGVSVPSNVADQPSSDAECIEGAANRARGALELVEDADYGIGMEGGTQQIGDQVYECGWMVVVDRKGTVGVGSSARFQMPTKILSRMEEGVELGKVMDELMGREKTNQAEGCMGILTKGHLPRTEAYSHGLLFAFVPFIADKMFWE